MEPFNLEALKKKLQDISEKSEHQDLEELPFPIRRRLHALKTLQKKRVDLSKELKDEILKLERQYHSKFASLYQERYLITTGKREPSPEELEAFSESGVQEVSDQVEGVPDFWLTALRNHPQLNSVITDEDAKALSYLKDLKLELLSDKPGFKLLFEFDPNEFFENQTLSKEYHLASPDDHISEDYVYDYAVGTDIVWKQGKNLCFKTVVRTQKHRTQKNTRTVRREEPLESFFHFFNPPSVPSEEEDEEALEELESRLQVDYEIGEIIKDQIIPVAADWFTGEALEYAELEDGYDEDDYDDEDDDDAYENEDFDDDAEFHSDDESEEYVEKKSKRKPSPRDNPSSAVEKPECKQQ